MVESRVWPSGNQASPPLHDCRVPVALVDCCHVGQALLAELAVKRGNVLLQLGHRGGADDGGRHKPPAGGNGCDEAGFQQLLLPRAESTSFSCSLFSLSLQAALG